MKSKLLILVTATILGLALVGCSRGTQPGAINQKSENTRSEQTTESDDIDKDDIDNPNGMYYVVEFVTEKDADSDILYHSFDGATLYYGNGKPYFDFGCLKFVAYEYDDNWNLKEKITMPAYQYNVFDDEDAKFPPEIDRDYAERIESYRPDGQIVSVWDIYELSEEYTYDDNDRLIYSRSHTTDPSTIPAWANTWDQGYTRTIDYYYTYDDNGKLIIKKEHGSDSDGTLWDSTYPYEYDEQGRLISETCYDDEYFNPEWSTPDKIATYTYYDDGSYEKFNYSGYAIVDDSIRYDLDGNIKQRNTYRNYYDDSTSTGSCISTKVTDYYYNDEGNLSYTYTNYEDFPGEYPFVEYRIVEYLQVPYSVFNDKQQILSGDGFSLTDELYGLTDYCVEHSAFQDGIQNIYVSEDLPKKQESYDTYLRYDYDNEGSLYRKVWYNSDNDYLGMYTYEYLENGHVIERLIGSDNVCHDEYEYEDSSIILNN